MHTLRLFAISIDAVRDIFGADPTLAEHLRSIAAAHFAPPAPEKPTSLLAKLGPLFRRNPAVEVDLSRPLRGDVDALLAGGYVPPDRQSQCWEVLLVWLQDLARAQATLQMTDLDEREFDLARAGLSADYALRQLAGRQLGIPLWPEPDRLVGYAKHVHAVETLEAMHALQETAEATFADLVASTQPVQQVLTAVAADPALDLVVVEAH